MTTAEPVHAYEPRIINHVFLQSQAEVNCEWWRARLYHLTFTCYRCERQLRDGNFFLHEHRANAA